MTTTRAPQGAALNVLSSHVLTHLSGNRDPVAVPDNAAMLTVLNKENRRRGAARGADGAQKADDAAMRAGAQCARTAVARIACVINS